MMLFEFQKYLNPIWVFNLEARDILYWIDYESLTKDERRYVNWDPEYEDLKSSMYDVSYQCWQAGLICKDQNRMLKLDSSSKNINDNYRFVRKYHRIHWIFYIFILRILSFRNPIHEIKGLISAFAVRPPNQAPKFYYPILEEFGNSVLAANPLVSIIIPTLTRYKYLRDALSDLEAQTYSNFEVIIVDQSSPPDTQFYAELDSRFRVHFQSERALWRARNEAIKKSNGEYILLYDDHSRVSPDWILNHLRCLSYFKVDISSGVSISKTGGRVPLNYSFFRWGDQVDTGNVMIRREVFEKIGLFDRQFERQRMGDGEFCVRSYLAGYTNVSNPLANRLHLKVGEGGLREMGSWDSFRPNNLLAPRPIPSVLYLTRKYFGNRLSILFLFQEMPMALVPYRFKSNRYLLALGCLMTLVLFPLLVFQVSRSWQISSRILKEGAKIDLM